MKLQVRFTAIENFLGSFYIMLTSVHDLAGKSVRFTNPVRIDKHKVHIVYTALDSKPLLVESPKMKVKKVQDVQPLSMTFLIKDDKYHGLLGHLDSLIRKDAMKHCQDYNLQTSIKEDEFQTMVLVSSKGVETKFFVANKKEAESNIESKNLNKVLQDACVRLICRLEGYTIDASKALIKPIWVIQQCLLADQSDNPIGTDYYFLEDGDDKISYFSE